MYKTSERARQMRSALASLESRLERYPTFRRRRAWSQRADAPGQNRTSAYGLGKASRGEGACLIDADANCRATERPQFPSGPSARLRHDPDVWAWRLPPFRVRLFGFVVGNGAGDDHVLALLPVHRGCDLVLGGELQRIDHPQDFVEVAPSRHRVDEDELDL